ncbi:MAG TPA: class I SAM-dependent methyltransferase [Vicinamibacterales bacterium]|nr:class I SAM-dependent methyltransferase [Vicinamibacterales bacterium]
MRQSAGGGSPAPNLDPRTVRGFGDEWSRFDQSELSQAEWQALFDQYFHLVDWAALPAGAEGFDLGCGSGRWARGVAPRVGRLHLIDASAEALGVARRTLADAPNCVFHHASVDALPLAPSSMDFGYSLGVLHHVPDTAAGLRAAVSCLRPGAPMLVYLYYALENRPAWYRALWRASDLVRRAVAALPFGGRYVVSQLVALAVYWPLARLAALAERLGLPAHAFPLAFYRHRSVYTMRTDALDRFGTRLEQRFTRDAIDRLMADAGLERIRFSEAPPYWMAIGWRRPDSAS